MKILNPLNKNKITNNFTINKQISFENSNKLLYNDNEIQTVNYSELFNYERENCKNYNVYGRLEFNSILNNLKLNYFFREDFFERYTKGPSKNIKNSFDIYLVYNSNEYELINNKYVSKYRVVSKPIDIDIIDCSFSKNIFFEKNYIFNIKNIIDITNIKDFFGKPITEFFLYFKYKKAFSEKKELLYYRKYDINSDENNYSLVELDDIEYDYNEDIYGSLIDYPSNSFDVNIINKQNYIIEMEYNNENLLRFIYDPFMKIEIRAYSDNLNFSNIKLKNIINIPDYAKKVDNYDNYIWRDILEYGYIDPISNIGYDFPFMNNQHYIYNNLDLNIIPDLTHSHTNEFFNEIKINSYNTNLYKNNPLKIINRC